MAASKTGGGVGTNQYAIKGSSIVDQVAAANRAAALTGDLDADGADVHDVLNAPCHGRCTRWSAPTRHSRQTPN